MVDVSGSKFFRQRIYIWYFLSQTMTLRNRFYLKKLVKKISKFGKKKLVNIHYFVNNMVLCMLLVWYGPFSVLQCYIPFLMTYYPERRPKSNTNKYNIYIKEHNCSFVSPKSTKILKLSSKISFQYKILIERICRRKYIDMNVTKRIMIKTFNTQNIFIEIIIF